MSQIRKWSSNDSPAKAQTQHAAARRRTAGRGRRRRTSRGRDLAVPVAQVTVTPSSSCSSAGHPVTPADVDAAARRRCARRAAASVSHCEMFTNGGKGERPRSAKVKLNSSRSRWKVRAVVQVTPRRAISAPTPTASQTSRTSRCWQIALLPTRSRSGRPSRTTTGRPHRASSSAVGLADRPAAEDENRGSHRGQPCSSSQTGAVALRRPDDRALDAVELVPEPLHVEGQAVLEDRPAAELRGERLVGGRRRRP